MSRRTTITIVAWLLLIVAAAPFDVTVARYFDRIDAQAWLEKYQLAFALKLPGEYVVTLIVAAAVGLLAGWRNSVFIAVAGLVSGVNGLMKWAVGRARPFRSLSYSGRAPLQAFHFEPMRGGILKMFSGHDLCFPSGHTALAFATATALAIRFPRGRVVFFIIATLTGIERFAETAHYLSDVVAGAALGVLGTQLLAHFIEPLSTRSPMVQTATIDQTAETTLQASIHE